MARKALLTELVFATYFMPSGTLKPCQNANMRLFFSPTKVWDSLLALVITYFLAHTLLLRRLFVALCFQLPK